MIAREAAFQQSKLSINISRNAGNRRLADKQKACYQTEGLLPNRMLVFKLEQTLKFNEFQRGVPKNVRFLNCSETQGLNAFDRTMEFFGLKLFFGTDSSISPVANRQVY